jgi:hypothetical protein
VTPTHIVLIVVWQTRLLLCYFSPPLSSLQNTKLYCGANVDDLVDVLEHIHSVIPDSPLLAIGVSLGRSVKGGGEGRRERERGERRREGKKREGKGERRREEGREEERGEGEKEGGGEEREEGERQERGEERRRERHGGGRGGKE